MPRVEEPSAGHLRSWNTGSALPALGASQPPAPAWQQPGTRHRNTAPGFSLFGPRETEQFVHVLIGPGFHRSLFSWAKQHGMGFQSSWLAAMSRLPHIEQHRALLTAHCISVIASAFS